MNLYILRHGIAEDHGTPGVKETERALTPKGKKKIRKAARGLQKLDVVINMIFTSPLKRAVQTAGIVADVFELDEDIVETEFLLPNTPFDHLLKFLQSYGNVENIMLVGHEPHLGEFISTLVWGTPEGQIDFKKGAVCKLRLVAIKPGARAVLEWIMTADQLAMIE
jgi:phosphohistidine phosphatase